MSCILKASEFSALRVATALLERLIAFSFSLPFSLITVETVSLAEGSSAVLCVFVHCAFLNAAKSALLFTDEAFSKLFYWSFLWKDSSGLLTWQWRIVSI